MNHARNAFHVTRSYQRDFGATGKPAEEQTRVGGFHFLRVPRLQVPGPWRRMRVDAQAVSYLIGSSQNKTDSSARDA